MKAEEVADFRAFVESRWSGLVRTAYLLTGDHGIAEDVAQSALTKTYVNWRRVQRADNPDAYVRRVLVTTNTDRFRKIRVAEQLSADPPQSIGEDPYSRIDQQHMLRDALADLPARQRAVVVLRYWDDLPETEVARILGCALGTVKSQAAKGLAKLREHPGLTGARLRAEEYADDRA
ncbi:SigE family RNA polymerase sigma factor [Embleya sp. NBC_00896]|uniref:SigE family RNA polymerase sigma factor n=1 Tax=Embleya sp. NBC_00896 TaxID=2975961 RepID=UPI002F91BBDC|nr:SigE family RNA polymerase sigma factor [Embleya sp. NBC_00896]